ncbi:MAG TPA: transporter substrate-binding domain-containing protein [Actinomycetota bacterium]|jgi:ABC-type amino acid transport substrate-binding protein
MARRSSILVALIVVLGASACVPPVEETTTPERFDPETVMGQIQKRGALEIGVASDRPPFGFVEEGGQANGLTVDLGGYVAEALHVDAVYVPAPNDELLEMIESRAVDMAFPITTITEPLVRQHSFTDPYWIAHQRVLAFDGRHEIEDLAAPVCSFIDPETEVLLSDLDTDLEVMTAVQPDDCLTALTAGSPATASDVVLMGLLDELEERGVPRLPTIGGDDLTTEGYGAVVIQDAPGFAEVVANILERAKDEGIWQSAVDEWVDGVELEEPPELTLEEAAALYPANA